MKSCMNKIIINNKWNINIIKYLIKYSKQNRYMNTDLSNIVLDK